MIRIITRQRYEWIHLKTNIQKDHSWKIEEPFILVPDWYAEDWKISPENNVPIPTTEVETHPSTGLAEILVDQLGSEKK